MIEAFVHAQWQGSVRTRYNPFFRLAGPLASIWIARDLLLERDFVVANGDTAFLPAVLDELLDGLPSAGGAIVATRCDEFAADDVRLRISGDAVVEAGKAVSDARARSAGILCVVGEKARRGAVEVLDEMVRAECNLDSSTPWHSWVGEIARKGWRIAPVFVPGETWTEVDLHPELDQLRRQLAAKLPL
jgi:choline kinase